MFEATSQTNNGNYWLKAGGPTPTPHGPGQHPKLPPNVFLSRNCAHPINGSLFDYLG